MIIFKRTVRGKEQDDYSVRFQHRGKAYLKSLGTPVKKEAERRAREFHELTTSAEWKEVSAVLTGKVAGKSDEATMGQVFEIYSTRATDVRRRLANVASMRRILQMVFPGRNVDAIRTGELTREVVRTYEKAMLARVNTPFERPGREARVLTDYSTRTTIKSSLGRARAIFAKDKMHFYDDLKLGDLRSFLNEPVTAPERRKPKAPDQAALRRMVEALPQLKKDAPAVYCAFILMARLGMRPIEVRQAREWWVQPMGEHYVMEIIKRPEEKFDPKASQGMVPLAADVWAELETFKHLRTDGYLLPGRTLTDRAHVVERELSQWVGQFLRGRGGQTSYELRRWAGSLVMDAHNGDATAARDFLRHSSITTTLEWYAYRLSAVRPLGMAGLAV